jgi:hypothetical protein
MSLVARCRPRRAGGDSSRSWYHPQALEPWLSSRASGAFSGSEARRRRRRWLRSVGARSLEMASAWVLGLRFYWNFSYLLCKGGFCTVWCWSDGGRYRSYSWRLTIRIRSSLMYFRKKNEKQPTRARSLKVSFTRVSIWSVKF